MTAVLPRADTVDVAESDAVASRARTVRERVAFGLLLVVTAALYLWNLSASGWANAFYSAAAQAGGDNWTAMLFGSSDASNAITVDKTPAALWVMDVSVRLFGLNSWSVLAPQALEGVAAVALLYAAVRRASGPSAALLAGTVFAFTPVAALMFRFNNPDALLVLMLVAGAYCVQRACEKDSSRWWLVGAGAAVGFVAVADHHGMRSLDAKPSQRGLEDRGVGLDGADLEGQHDLVEVIGGAALRAGLLEFRGRAAADAAAAVGGRAGCVRCIGWLVPPARRDVAVLVPSVHRRLAARQHRRIGVGLQRFRSADG